jgi:peptide/nickel transport system permease protein
MTALDVTVSHTKRKNFFWDVFSRLFKEKPLGAFGLVVALLFLLIALFANFIAPYPPSETHILNKLSPPSAKYLLGADNLGRDLLSRIIYGARVSYFIGLGASFINVLVAGLLGLFSGYMGKYFDLIVQRFVDIAISFPGLILLMIIISTIGSGLWQITVTLGVIGGILWSRVVRSAVLVTREAVYINAAIVTGGKTEKIIFRHIIPNVMPVLIIIFSMSIAGNILAEAGLSFLGFGVQPPTASWGSMLSREGTLYMLQGWWLAVFPGLAIMLVVFSVNVFGDAVRDILDPRLRSGVGSYKAENKKKHLEGGSKK